MTSEAWHILMVDDNWLVELCKKVKAEGSLIEVTKEAVAVLKLLNGVAIKYGRGVSHFEAQL